MRALAIAAVLALVVILGACPEHGKGGGDGGGILPDAALTCAPSGGCPNGPACGVRCCNQGEACVGGICQCGQNPACTIAGDTCQIGGPVAPPELIPPALPCGFVCCGSPQHPCPIGD